MTVKELIEELKKYNEDWTVCSYDDNCCGYIEVTEAWGSNHRNTVNLE